MRALSRAALLPVLLVLAGCSISTSLSTSSTSSQSSSDSSNSLSTSSDSSTRSSESSSRSSRGGDRHELRYREDVRTYTAANVRARTRLETFQKELGELARTHGVTQWEEDETTYLGIGEGLGDAAVGRAELEMYKTSFSRSDPVKMQAIQRGYDTR